VSIPTYLVKNRFGIYSYRLITPIAIRKLFPAFKAEVRLTTRSRSVRQATRIAAYFHYHYQTFFEQIKQQGKIMDDWLDDDTSARQISPALLVDEHIQEITFSRVLMSLLQRGKEIENLCTVYSEYHGAPVGLSDFKLTTPDEIERFISIANIFASEDVFDQELYLAKLKLKPKKDRQSDKSEILKSVHLGAVATRQKRAAQSIQSMDHVSSDDDYRSLKTYSREQVSEIVKHLVKEHQSGRTYSFRVDRDSDEMVFEDVKIDNAGDIASLITMLESFTKPTAAQPVAEKPEHEIRFSEFAKIFLSYRQKNLGNRQNKTQAQAAVDLFIEYFSDDPFMHEVSRQMAEELHTVLGQLPPNRKQNKQSKGLNVFELLEREWEVTLKSQGIDNYLKNYRSMFDYAIANGYAIENPFKKMKALGKKRKKSEEKADKTDRLFTERELCEIFTTPVFTQKATRSYYFWVPLLCLYTGARLSEIAQLDVHDVIKKDGVWCLDINERTSDKSLKTPASARLVPLHRDIIDLGFIRYVETIKAAQEDWSKAIYRTRKLWWDIFSTNGKYANACSKNLDKIFDKVNIPNFVEDRKGSKYHAFRHTLTKLLKEADVSESTYGRILGHDVAGTPGGMYGGKDSIKFLQTTLNKVRPLPQDVLDALKPYRLPVGLLPSDEQKKFKSKKYLVNFSDHITDKNRRKSMLKWSGK